MGGTGRRRAPRAFAVSVALGTAACGARLSPAQQAYYDHGPAAVLAASVSAPASVAAAGPALPGADTAAPTAGTHVGGQGAVASRGAAPAASAVGTSAPPVGTSTSRTARPTVARGATEPFADGTVKIDPAVCSSVASGPGVSTSELDLGVVSTQTGPIPGAFVGVVHGIQAFATYLNSIGGICGRKVVVKAGDDNLQVSQNAAATQSLASQVFAFVGSFSADDSGMAQAIGGRPIPDIGQALTEQRFGMTNNFSPEPIAGWNAAPYLFWKQKHYDATQHMALLTYNQPQSQANLADEKAAMESVGYKIVYEDPNIEPTQSDFTADAEAMKAAGAQGVAFIATAAGDAGLARAVANIGYSLDLPTWSTTAYDQAFLTTAGSAAEGTTLEIQWAMYEGEDIQTVPMVATFNRYYQALYHTTPDEFANYSWLSGLLFIEGLNRGGALNQTALLAGLQQVNHFSGGGLVAPDDPAHKTPPTCYLIVNVVGGKFVRDPANPTGFNCQFAPHYYFHH